MTEQERKLVEMYIEPSSNLEITHYQIVADAFLTNIRLFMGKDSNGEWFAKQYEDDFWLPLNAYKKEILADRFDVEHLKKNPKPQTQYFMTPTHKAELCSVLSMYKNQQS